MELVINLDEALAERAAAEAERRGISLSALFSELVEQLDEEERRRRAAEEFVQVALRQPGEAPPGWKFDREECHQRGVNQG